MTRLMLCVARSLYIGGSRMIGSVVWPMMMSVAETPATATRQSIAANAIFAHAFFMRVLLFGLVSAVLYARRAAWNLKKALWAH